MLSIISNVILIISSLLRAFSAFQNNFHKIGNKLSSKSFDYTSVYMNSRTLFAQLNAEEKSAL